MARWILMRLESKEVRLVALLKEAFICKGRRRLALSSSRFFMKVSHLA